MSQNSYFVVWFVWSWPIFRWIPGSFFHPVTSGCLEKVFLCVKNYQDFIKLRQENFLTCLDKILPRSYQGVPRNFVYQDLGKMCQVLHELARSCMTWQGVSSFVSLGNLLVGAPFETDHKFYIFNLNCVFGCCWKFEVGLHCRRSVDFLLHLYLRWGIGACNLKLTG